MIASLSSNTQCVKKASSWPRTDSISHDLNLPTDRIKSHNNKRSWHRQGALLQQRTVLISQFITLHKWRNKLIRKTGRRGEKKKVELLLCCADSHCQLLSQLLPQRKSLIDLSVEFGLNCCLYKVQFMILNLVKHVRSYLKNNNWGIPSGDKTSTQLFLNPVV